MNRSHASKLLHGLFRIVTTRLCHREYQRTLWEVGYISWLYGSWSRNLDQPRWLSQRGGSHQEHEGDKWPCQACSSTGSTPHAWWRPVAVPAASYISIGDSFLTATSPPWQQLHKLYSVKMNVEQYCRKSVLNLLLFMLNLWNYRISFFAQKSWKWWPKAVSSSFHSKKYHVWLSLKQQWKYKKDIFCLFICSTCWCQGNY